MKKLLLTAIALFTFNGIITAQDKWQNTVSASFGTSYNQRISAMHVFNGKIYAGTANNTGEVYSSSTGDKGSWSQVYSQSFVQSIDAINSTSEGGGYIYISGYAYGSDNPRIYRSVDGSSGSWSSYYESNGDKLPFVFPFKGSGAADSIYIVRNSYPSSIILKSAFDSNDPTNLSNTFDTIFDLGPLSSPYTYISSYTQHNNRIYVGTSNAKIWMSSTDGNTWSDTLFQPGFGNSNNYCFTAMSSFGGYLYVGTQNDTDGAQIWRTNDGATWTQLSQSFSGGKISSLNVLSGVLWATFESSSYGYAKILKSTNGTTFISSDSTSFGLSQNHGMAGNTAEFGSHIYYSCGNMDSGMPLKNRSNGPMGSEIFAGQIWRTCTGVAPTVNLGVDKLVCGGVSVTFDAGTGFTSYLWSNSETTQTISVNTPETYSVTVTASNGCQGWDVAELKNKPTPDLNFTNPEGPVALCKNDTLSIIVDANSNLRDTMPSFSVKKLVPISDILGTVYDTIAVSGINDYANVALVSVTIDSLDHAYDGELTISLKAPDNSYITLVSNAGSSGQNFRGTTFARTGADIMVNSAPFTGQFTTYDPFNYIGGGPADGNWLLAINDYYGGNDGNLKGWSLKFTVKDTVITYSWTPSTGLTASNKANVKAIGINSITYTLTATNNIGCIAKDSVIITVPEMKVANASVVSCYGDSVMLSATGGDVYNWSPASGLTDTIGDTIFAKPTAPTKYYVTDYVKGCTITDSVMVNANPQLMVDAGVAQTICFGTNATINATVTGGTPGYTYVWNDGSNTFTTQSVTASPGGKTTYKLTVTDANGCSGKDSIVIDVNPLPFTNPTAFQAICLGDSVTLNGVASGGTSPYLFSWNDGSTTYAIQNLKVSPAIKTTYTLSVTDLPGCIGTATTIVSINALPIADAGATQAVCLGNSVTLNGSATGGVTPYNYYVWDNGSTTDSLQNVSVSPTVITTYTLTVIDGAGCIGKDTTVVTINSLPTANAGLAQTICYSDVATIAGSGTGGTAPYSYSWSSGSSVYSLQNVTVTPSSTTTYTLTVTDNLGCTANDNVTVSVTPSTDIYGHVSYTGGNLTNATVILYQYVAYNTHFDSIQSATPDLSGNYHFANVSYGEYLIEVFADTSIYPNSIPTYFGNEFLWDSSTVVVHNCISNDTADITLIEIPVPTGSGFLSGFIKEGEGFARSTGDPIPDIDVKMGKNPGGGIAGVATTDGNGYYKFTNVDIGEYTLFADIPGLGRDSSYTVKVTLTDLIHDSLNYKVDSNSVYIEIPSVVTGVKTLVSNAINKFSVYPNPSSGNASVEYTIEADANVSLGIYNVLGVKVSEMVQGDQSAGSYKYSINARKNNLNSGVYFVTLIIDGKTSIQKMVFTE